MLVLKGLRADCLSLVEFSRRVLNYEVVLMAKPYLLTEDFSYVKIRHGQTLEKKRLKGNIRLWEVILIG